MDKGKRAFDLIVAATSLLLLSPLLFVVAVAIWLQDFRSPLYVAPRVAKGGGTFKMVKFRSMTVGADRAGIHSTSGDDHRITRVGRLVRAYKLDELPQLWNVVKGELSLVGPRPQVPREVAIYTPAEREMLIIRPGITDLSSIVFSDEGDILQGANDPDLAYNQLIRPWKSRLSLLYVRHHTFRLDLELLALTAVGLFSRKRALSAIARLLERLGADPMTRRAACRQEALVPYPPPGSTTIVTAR